MIFFVLRADQHFTKSTRRKLLKGFRHFLMLLHSSVQCFGFTMHLSRRNLLFFSSPSTPLELLWSQLTLHCSYFMPQRRPGYIYILYSLSSFNNLTSNFLLII